MSETVYIDVLICVNLIINYFILYGSIKYIKINVSAWRLILAAFAGSLFSLIILLPKQSFFISLLVKFLSVLSMIIIILGKKPLKLYLKLLFTVLLITFSMCGILSAVYFSSSDSILYTNNGSVYFDISAEFLIFTSFVCYLILEIITKITGKYKPESLYSFVEFSIKNKPFKLLGKVDTGNSLVEPFSQSPVIVVNSKKIDLSLINEENQRLVPFSTVSEKGLLKAFKAENLKINRKNVMCEVYIAYSDNVLKKSNVEALINPEIFDYCYTNINSAEGENKNEKDIPFDENVDNTFKNEI